MNKIGWVKRGVGANLFFEKLLCGTRPFIIFFKNSLKKFVCLTLFQDIGTFRIFNKHLNLLLHRVNDLLKWGIDGGKMECAKRGVGEEQCFLEKLLYGIKPFCKFFKNLLRNSYFLPFRDIGIFRIPNLLHIAQLCPRGALRCLRGGSKLFREVPKWFCGAPKCIHGVPDSLRGSPNLFNGAPNFLRGVRLCPH